MRDCLREISNKMHFSYLTKIINPESSHISKTIYLNLIPLIRMPPTVKAAAAIIWTFVKVYTSIASE